MTQTNEYQSITPPQQENINQLSIKKKRNSNLELYRIIVMLMIIAHHYVVNSGLMEVLKENTGSLSSSALLIFGAWGKTGINCFMLITGYFMCVQSYSAKKLLKLYSQILFYTIIIYFIFCITGHEHLGIINAAKKLIPVLDLSPNNFIGCFLVFYLLIPFLNILIKHLSQDQHRTLSLMLILIYVLLPSIPIVNFPLNYIGWFSALYLIASYIRLYSNEWTITHKQWGILTLSFIILGSISIIGLEQIFAQGYTSLYIPFFFVTDSNKIFAFAISITSFMWFKDLKINYSPIINLMGAATFGVFLIHTNSDAMRHWLWRDIVDCIGHYSDSPGQTIIYALGSIIVIFISCVILEIFRLKFVEPKVTRFLDNFPSKNLHLST